MKKSKLLMKLGSMMYEIRMIHQEITGLSDENPGRVHMLHANCAIYDDVELAEADEALQAALEAHDKATKREK